MAQKASQKKSFLAMAGFLAFVVLVTLLLIVANYISQRTEQEDTSAQATTYDKHYFRLFLHETGKRFYTQFCDAASVAPTGSPIDFNNCGAMRTHAVTDLKLPSSAFSGVISSISAHNHSSGDKEYVIFIVTPADVTSEGVTGHAPTYYAAQCEIQNGNINSCFENPTWYEHTSPAKADDPQHFPKSLSYEESEYGVQDNDPLFLKAELSPVIDNKQYLYTAVCRKGTQVTCLQSQIELLSSTPFNFPSDVNVNFKGIGYSVENHNGVDKLRESFILSAGDGYVTRLCTLNTENIHASCGGWGKVLFSASIKGLPEKTIRDWTSMIGELAGVPWNNIAKNYIQTFLSTDKTKLYQRYCAVNEDLVEPTLFGDSVIYTSCNPWTTHEITSLNSTGLTIEPQKLKSIDFFDYKKTTGEEFMRQQLVINDSANDLDKLYTRDCPISFKNLECTGVTWSSTNVSTLQIVDVNQTLGRIRGLDTTITSQGESSRLRQVALQEDGKAIYSRDCAYNNALELSSCSAWNKVLINTLDFDNDPTNGIGGIEDVLLATDTYTQLINGVQNIRQTFLREGGQSAFTRICRLNNAPNTGSFNCQADSRLWSEVDLNAENGDDIELIADSASGLDSSVSTAHSLALPVFAEPLATSYLQTVLSHDKTKIYERSCTMNSEANGETINYTECSSWKTNPVTALNTIATATKPAVNFGATGITVKSFNMYRQVLDGGVVSVRQSVHTNEGASDYIYNRNCTIAQDGKLGCTENNPWNRESFRTTIGKDTVIGGVNITTARHVSLMLTSINNNTNQTRRKVVLSENGSLWLSRTCPYQTNEEGFEAAECYQAAWVPDSPTAQVQLPTILSTGYVAQPYNHKQSVHVYLVEESGEYFHDRICSLNTGNNEGYWNCANDGLPGQFARKAVSTLNLPTSAGGKLNSIYGLVSEATSLGLPEAPVAKTYVRTFLSEDKGTIYEQSCPVDETLTGDTIKYNDCTEFKSYPVSVLNGKKSNGTNITFTSENVDSVNFMNFKDSNGNEKIKLTVLVNGTDLYTRTCGLKNASKAMNCTDSNKWSSQKVGKLNIHDGDTKINTSGGYDATIAVHKESTQNPVLKDYIREVVLSADYKSIFTRNCPATTSGEANTTDLSKCSEWNKVVFETQLDFNDNGTFNDEDIIIGIDSFVQKNEGALDIKVAFIREGAEKYFTRICPLNEYALTGSHNCNAPTPKRTFSEVMINNIENMPVTKASGINGLYSTATGLGFQATTTTATPTPGFAAISCSEKEATFTEEGAYPESEVTYTLRLSYPTPGVDGDIIVRDYYSADTLEMDEESLAEAGCEIPSVLGASTYNPGQGKVLGVSDYYAERGSILISIILLSIVAGGTAYVLVVNNKSSLKSDLLKKNPYLAALVASGAVLLLGGVLIILTRDDVSPSQTPATSEDYIECEVEAGTETITYKATLTGEVGEEVSNYAEVLFNGVTSEETCESTFTIEEDGTPEASHTPTAEVTVTPSETVQVTPSSTPENPSPTPTAGLTSSPTPLITPSPTPGVATTPEVTVFATPSATPYGIACGPADVDKNDYFDIVDFGGTDGFASFYQRRCNDSGNDFSNPTTGVNCGSKDSVNGPDTADDGLIDLSDFVSFADRYNNPLCTL